MRSGLRSSLDRKLVEMMVLDAVSRDLPETDGSAPSRTRNDNPLIKSQTKGSQKVSSRNDLRIATSPVSHHFPTDTCLSDLDLTTVIRASGRLPDSIKAGILAMVNVALKCP